MPPAKGQGEDTVITINFNVGMLDLLLGWDAADGNDGEIMLRQFQRNRRCQSLPAITPDGIGNIMIPRQQAGPDTPIRKRTKQKFLTVVL